MARGSKTTPRALPSFLPALHEDPLHGQLDGWLVDGDEYEALAQRLDRDGSVVLVLGEPSQAYIDLVKTHLSPASLLLLPPSSKPSSSYSSHVPPTASNRALAALAASRGSPTTADSARSTGAPRVVHLSHALSPTSLGKIYEEAILHATRWRKGKAKAKQRGGVTGTETARSSLYGMSAAGADLTATCKRQSSLFSFGSSSDCHSSSTSNHRGDGTTFISGQPSAPNERPIDIVLHFLPGNVRSSHGTTMSLQPTLQSLLSAAFLVTAASLPILSANKTSSAPSSRLAVSSSARSSPRPRSAPLPSVNSNTHHMQHLSSHTSTPSLFSIACAARTGADPDAVLVHILPPSTPGTQPLPVLLDRTMQPFLDAHPAVAMIALPGMVLASSPVTISDVLSGGGDSEEEEEDDDQLSSAAASSSSCSSQRRIPPPSPPLLACILASALRPPLLLPPMTTSRSSRRGSSSSLASVTSGPGGGVPSSASIFNKTYIPSESAVSFIPAAPSSSPCQDHTPHLVHSSSISSGPSDSGHSTPIGYGSISESGTLTDHDALPSSLLVSSPRDGMPAPATTHQKGSMDGKSSSFGGWWSKMFGKRSKSLKR